MKLDHLDVFLKPTKTFKKVKGKGTLLKAAITFLATTFVFAMIWEILFLTTSQFLPGFGTPKMPTLDILTLALSPILAFILGILATIFKLVETGIHYTIAKLLGGKGKFNQLYYMYSIPFPGLAILGTLKTIPIIGWILDLVVIIYSIFLQYKAVKVNFGLNRGKAALTVLLPLVIIFILLLLLVITISLFAVNTLFEISNNISQLM